MKLYHYTKKEVFDKHISVSRLLRFTDPFGKNCSNPDDKEYFYPKDLIMKFVIERIEPNTTNKFLLEFKKFCLQNEDNALIKEKIENKTKDFRFISRSKNPNNDYLISSFVNDDVCRIEIDTELLNYETFGMFYVSDVIYTEENSEADITDVYSRTLSAFLTKFENIKRACNVKDETIDYSEENKYINVLALLSAFIKTKDGKHEREEETRILLDFGMAYRNDNAFRIDNNIGEILPSSYGKNNYLFLRRDERHAYELLKNDNVYLNELAYLILVSRIGLLTTKIHNYYKSTGILVDEQFIKENFMSEFVKYCMIIEPLNYRRSWIEPGDFYLSLDDFKMNYCFLYKSENVDAV